MVWPATHSSHCPFSSVPAAVRRLPSGHHFRCEGSIPPAKLQFLAGREYRATSDSHTLNRGSGIAHGASRDSAVLEPKVNSKADGLEQQVAPPAECGHRFAASQRRVTGHRYIDPKCDTVCRHDCTEHYHAVFSHSQLVLKCIRR